MAIAPFHRNCKLAFAPLSAICPIYFISLMAQTWTGGYWHVCILLGCLSQLFAGICNRATCTGNFNNIANGVCDGGPTNVLQCMLPSCVVLSCACMLCMHGALQLRTGWRSACLAVRIDCLLPAASIRLAATKFMLWHFSRWL